MPPRDISMGLEEFRQYYRKNKRLILAVRAYDASGRRWIEGEEIFRTPGTYTLIVVQFNNRTFLRINVKPSLEIAYAPGKYASAGTWSKLGVYLTYEEKEFLKSIGGDALPPYRLIEAVASSAFPGRDELAKKLKKAADEMQR